MSTEAFVTLATNDGYALGALTLAESIQQVRTNRNLVVLVSNDLSNLFKFDSISLAIDLKSLFV
jgi:glycogenin glucosyltransferase